MLHSSPEKQETLDDESSSQQLKNQLLRRNIFNRISDEINEFRNEIEME